MKKVNYTRLQICLSEEGRSIYIFKPILYVVLLAFITGCSSFGDDITDNKSWTFKNDPAFSNYVQIYTGTVGTQGEVIDLDGLLVNIPNGTFSEPQNIKIYKSETIKPFGKRVASDMYVIDGIGESIKNDISIEINYKGLDKNPILTVGYPMYSPSLDTIILCPVPVDAIYDSGRFSYTLEAKATKSQTTTQTDMPEKSLITLCLMVIDRTEVEHEKVSGKYTIYYPRESIDPSLAQKIQELLVTIENTLTNEGFNLSARNLKEHPLKIIFIDPDISFHESWDGFYFYTFMPHGNDQTLRDGFNDGIIFLDERLLNGLNDQNLHDVMMEIIAHEYLHFVQNLYEFNTSTHPDSSTLWLMEASSTWFGVKMSSEKPYLPYNTEKNYYSFSKGWQSNSEDQGYGLSFLFFELYNEMGYKGILEVYNKIKSGTLPKDPYDPCIALYSSTYTDFASIFLQNSIRNFLTGSLFDITPIIKRLHSYMKTHSKNRGSISSDNSSGKFENKELVNLSTFDCYLMLKKDDIINSKKWEKPALKFSINDHSNRGLLVFKISNYPVQLDLVGEIKPNEPSEVTIDLNKLDESESYEYVAIYTFGHYNPDNNGKGYGVINYKIDELGDIEEEPKPLDFPFFKYFHFIFDPGGYDYTGPSFIFSYDREATRPQLTWNGNAFSASWNGTYQNDMINEKGSLSGTVSKNSSNVVVVSFVYENAKTDNLLGNTETWNVTTTELPFSGPRNPDIDANDRHVFAISRTQSGKKYTISSSSHYVKYNYKSVGNYNSEESNKFQNCELYLEFANGFGYTW